MKKRLIIMLVCMMALTLILPKSIAFADMKGSDKWKAAYQTTIEKERKASINSDSRLYLFTLYDIDKDGVPELFLRYGDTTASEIIKVFGYQNGKVAPLDGINAGGNDTLASYPDGNGVLRRHAAWGAQTVWRWTLKKDTIVESAALFREEDVFGAEYTEIGEIVRGSVALTEHGIEDLSPLMCYEDWEKELLLKSGAGKTGKTADPSYPNNDPQFFKKVLDGDQPVIPGRVSKTSYFDWPEPKHVETRLSDFLVFMEKDGYDTVGQPDQIPVKLLYADLDGDGKMEAVCSRIRQETEPDYTTQYSVFLHEQSGKVYAYGLASTPVLGVDSSGILYSWQEYWEGESEEKVFKLFFDGDHCFQVIVPFENYGGPRHGDGVANSAASTSSPDPAHAAPGQTSPAKTANPFQNAAVGDVVKFGHYEQDDNLNNGPEEITWLVLERNGDRVLAISEFGLDSHAYNGSYGEITWEHCDLRRWLNDDFLNAAFDSDEQSKILLADVSADKNPKSKADPGNTTQDRIFVLSIKEVEHYFDSKNDRFCKATPYAVARGSKVYRDIGTCWWWTRTPGCDNFYVSDVYGDGKINYVGGTAEQYELSVRPAMWVKLTA